VASLYRLLDTGQNRCQIPRAVFAIDSAAAIPEVERLGSKDLTG
jgi:hypothetical protein